MDLIFYKLKDNKMIFNTSKFKVFESKEGVRCTLLTQGLLWHTDSQLAPPDLVFASLAFFSSQSILEMEDQQ